MTYRVQILKRKIEAVCIFPFILLGRFIAFLRPLGDEYSIFFFFPFYHTGGVEKYNLAISGAAAGQKGIIFFTRKSTDTTFYEAFIASGHRVVDISKWTDNKWIYWSNLVYRGILSGYINRQQEKPVVFNGQSNFGYKLSPWIKNSIRQIECIHTFSTFSHIRQPYVQFYQTAFSPAFKTISDHKEHYQKIGVPVTEAGKFTHLITGIEVPASLPDKTGGAIKILFVGRGSPEKRVHLVAAIAMRVKAQVSDAVFIFAGEVKQYIPEVLQSWCDLRGNITDAAELAALYTQCDVLILTSLFEGFPLVVMEAMSHGLAVVSTAVGDVPVHVKDGVHGFIAAAGAGEAELETYFTEKLLELQRQPALLSAIRQRNYTYAVDNFSINQLGQKLQPFLNYNA